MVVKHKKSYFLDGVLLYKWKEMAERNIKIAYYLLKTEPMVKCLIARDIADIIYHYAYDDKFVHRLNRLFKQSKLNGYDLCKIAKKNYHVALLFLDSPKVSLLLSAKQKAEIIFQHRHIIYFTSELPYGFVKKIAFDNIEAALIILKAEINDEFLLSNNDKLNIFYHHHLEKTFSDLDHLTKVLKRCHLKYINDLYSNLLNEK